MSLPPRIDDDADDVDNAGHGAEQRLLHVLQQIDHAAMDITTQASPSTSSSDMRTIISFNNNAMHDVFYRTGNTQQERAADLEHLGGFHSLYRYCLPCGPDRRQHHGLRGILACFLRFCDLSIFRWLQYR